DYHYAREDYAQAADALRHAVEIAGDPPPELLFGYADALVMAGHYDEALAVARGSRFGPYRELIEGRVALEQDPPGGASAHLREGLRLWPNNAVARYLLGQADEGIGDFDGAISEYRYAIRADIKEDEVSLRLVALHEAEGADDLALAIAQQGGGA